MNGRLETVDDYMPSQLYDLMYSWYTVDIDFYVARAKVANGPVLEAACGTGRILIPTLEAGVDIDGFDLRPGMIEVLKRKATARGLDPRVTVGDMRDFRLPRRYALITIPFRSFMHLMTTEDQIRALRRIQEHLAPGGALVFNVFYPCFDAFVNPRHDVSKDHRVVDPDTGRTHVLRMVSDDNDRVNQVKHVERELIELGEDGQPARVRRHSFDLRWTWKFEMELLLAQAGFARFDVRGGFDGRPLERDTDEMVWTAWRS